MNKVTITISGSQGTGKSLIARALAQVLNERGVPSSNLDEPNYPNVPDALKLLDSISCMPVEVDIVTTNASPRAYIVDDLRDALKEVCGIAEAQSKLNVAYRLQRRPSDDVINTLHKADERIANIRDDFGLGEK